MRNIYRLTHHHLAAKFNVRCLILRHKIPPKYRLHGSGINGVCG